MRRKLLDAATVPTSYAERPVTSLTDLLPSRLGSYGVTVVKGVG
jgi:hypothetical protein